MASGTYEISKRDDWTSVGENRVLLLFRAEPRLGALTDLIDNAEHSLKLFYYMFEGDEIGRLIRDKLVAACERGVAVDLMVDSFGSNGAPRSFFDPVKAAGGSFAIFSPRFSTSYFVRNHQKFIIADDKRAMLGGFNIADQYFDRHEADEDSESNETSWCDLGVVIEGPEVEVLADYHVKLKAWVDRENGNIRQLRKLVRSWDAGDDKFQWLLGGPSNRLSRWAWAIKKDLEKGNRLDLVSAYFSPGQGLLRRIARLSKTDGRVRLILAGKTDNAATIGASRLLYSYLLKRKANIYEYQPKRLHAKIVVVDDVVYLGSANFDLRSLFINVEMMVRIESPEFAERARNLADRMADDSLLITRDLHQSRKGLLNRLRWALSYFVVNTVDYTVTRRLNFGVKK